MKKRVLALVAAVMLLSSSATCVAVEPRASHYFDGYILGLSAEGKGEMAVSFSVLGTGTMEKIGVFSIRIEEETVPGEWVTTFTRYGSDDPDTFYTYDFCDHSGCFTFSGIPTVKYRAAMVAYAQNASGREYSEEIFCTGKVCK